MLKLLIFDLDGTLADTSQDIADAVNYALEPFGQRTFLVEEIKAMVGSGISKLLESLIPPNLSTSRRPLKKGGNIMDFEKGGDERRFEKRKNNGELEKGRGGNAKIIPVAREQTREIVVNRFLKYYSKHLLDNTKAYPHVKETLSKLGDYKKTVLSNNIEEYSKRILDELELSNFFDIIWGSDSVREKKPSPVPILDLLTKFNVAKDEAVIIGDSNYDIEAGKAAGIKIIGVAYGFRSLEFLKGADLIIDRFANSKSIFSSPT